MKRRLSSLIAALAFAVAVPATALAASPASAFTGTWISTDYDGSTQVLIVSGGAHPSVTFQDFYASSCDGRGDPDTHWVSAGSGEVDGNLLLAVFHKSGCGAFTIGAYLGIWQYDPATGTLVDESDIVWHRLT